ncbi:MAG: CDP-archaeol synthase [Candidatus Melainabacteria bacterium HGW-Melainabacteria-1]|nr:MAG: CDP-archaeol synthase [Candidatus Melainabacteria bacterium HGW-Melainabacteria-1]
MSPLPQLLYLILPLVLAGFSNMVWMKLPLLNSLRVPMDKGRNWRDGRRIFGDNKTWKGFVGMMIVTALWLQIFALIDIWSPNARALSLIPYDQWPQLAWFYGAVWGLFYVLAELPNSFIKRRLDIRPGGEAPGWQGQLFKIVDQADSVIGCLIGMLFFYVPSPLDALAILVLATGFHYLTNVLLFLVGLKKQAA